MEIFNVSENSGYEDIVSMGPRWWTEYREMDAVYRYQGWLMDLKIHFINRIIENQFPGLSDEETVKKFERMFKFEPDPDETLDERRRTVAAYYSGTGKLSFSAIKSIVRSYTGSDSDVWWDNGELNVRIYCTDEVPFSNRRAYQIIARRFPAHLVFWIRNVLCIFELNESVEVPRITYQTTLAWWKGCFDGSFLFDGTHKFNSGYPPYFRSKNRILSTIQEHFLFPIVKYPIVVINAEKAQIRSIQRAEFRFFDYCTTFDGEQLFDGSMRFDQAAPPLWDSQTYRTSVENEEYFNVNMYTPKLSAVFDGGFSFDGTIKFNSGREEL